MKSHKHIQAFTAAYLFVCLEALIRVTVRDKSYGNYGFVQFIVVGLVMILNNVWWISKWNCESTVHYVLASITLTLTAPLLHENCMTDMKFILLNAAIMLFQVNLQSFFLVSFKVFSRVFQNSFKTLSKPFQNHLKTLSKLFSQLF